MRINLTFALFIILLSSFAQTPRLKYVIYDFDGLDLGQTNLPDGDYKNFDMSYQITANPLSASDVLSDRVLRLDLNWSIGKGEFGKGITKYIELNSAADRFNFYFLNPISNFAPANAEVSIKEDDDQNGAYDVALDDKWISSVTIAKSANWQLISIPLSSFTDDNTGGNGIFDAGYTNNNGKVFTVSITFNKSALATAPEVYYTDMICFSEGALPVGSSILTPPASSPTDKCLLGSYAYRTPADSVPIEVEAMLPAGNKLEYINIFMPFSYSGTTASALPGSSVQRLLNNGYRPIITWEMMYGSYPPLDPIQPRLINILNGDFDAYIDQFANQIKTYNDTIIMRPFHEFDGNWYPWSVELNGQDPSSLIAAYRYLVNRFNALGATKVLWMWSPNSSPAPNASYNWFVDAYPGNAYVDIVGTSIYNHPFSGSPPWRSFRSLLAESYSYMTKYFPSKPFLIAESACRERYAGEVVSSQTKGEWICAMSEDLQSYFSKTRGLVFFNTNKEHDWRINSSAAALNDLKNCVWVDPYFNSVSTGIVHHYESSGMVASPNPFSGNITISVVPNSLHEDYTIRVFDISGKKLYEAKKIKSVILGEDYKPGIYIIEWSNERYSERKKIVKQ